MSPGWIMKCSQTNNETQIPLKNPHKSSALDNFGQGLDDLDWDYWVSVKRTVPHVHSSD